MDSYDKGMLGLVNVYYFKKWVDCENNCLEKGFDKSYSLKKCKYWMDIYEKNNNEIETKSRVFSPFIKTETN